MTPAEKLLLAEKYREDAKMVYEWANTRLRSMEVSADLTKDEWILINSVLTRLRTALLVNKDTLYGGVSEEAAKAMDHLIDALRET